MPLKVSDGIGAWIKDFKKSDAPQFKGKSEKKRRDQAIAAYLSAKRGNQNEAVDPKDKVRDRIKALQNKRQAHRAAIGDTDSASEKRKHTMASQIATKQIQMAQQKMNQMEGKKEPIQWPSQPIEEGIKFNAQDMVGHALKNVHKKKEEAMDRSSLDKAMAAFKKRGGKGHPDNKKKKEDVNELDTSTLVSYRKKANKQRYSNNISKRTQRTIGVDRANKKLGKRNIDKFGDHSPKGVDRMGNRKEDTSDAVKAFLAKGGKIKKLPPAKAQGYHGKDDPGKGIAGIMDRPDTKQIGTRKKVRSMEAKIDELSPATKRSYINKAAADIDNRSYAQGVDDVKGHEYSNANNARIRNRLKGISRATKEAKQTHVFDNEKDARAKAKEIGGKYVKGVGKSMGKHAAIKEGNEKPPFDPPYRKAGEPRKDKYGNVVKNVPRHLARQAARDLVKKKQNNEANLDELSYDKMNKYHDAAQKSKDRATNSAVATIMRKGDHSQDLKTRAKRIKGMELAKTRTLKKIRGDK